MLVLIHGGLHGSWCWDRLVPLLNNDTLAVDLPGRGGQPKDAPLITLDDWADHTLAEMAPFTGQPIVLVGHSLGGITLTEVARRMATPPSALVFISCLVPQEGRNAAETIAGDAWPLIFDQSGDFAIPPRESVRQSLCNDMNEADTNDVLSRLLPEPPGPFLAPITRRGLPDIPRVYIRPRFDMGVTPEKQSQMIENLGGAHDVWIDSGHNVMWSNPTGLADIINNLPGRDW
jgi:pimeloyl-ACP methyl ester carboxylesterase